MFWVLAVTYTVFLIYGSLIPLDFHSISLSKVWEILWDSSRYRYVSRSDVVANVLLYIPLAFFWQGLLWLRRGERAHLKATFILFLVCVNLSMAIEILQIFSTSRSFDLRDIVTNSSGSVIGLLAWYWVGPWIMKRISQWQSVQGLTSVAGALLPLYLFVLTVYKLMPFDLTLSPWELYQKFKRGSIILIPFGHSRTPFLEQINDFTMDFFVWLVVGLIWLFSSRKPAVYTWGKAAIVVIVLEILQIFVNSRVSDITDIVCGLLGTGIGVGLGALLIDRYPIISGTPAQYLYKKTWIVLASFACIAWLMVILWYYLFPFKFNFDTAFLDNRFNEINTLPFWVHFNADEFNAMADFLRILLMYAPLGAVLAFISVSIDEWRLKKYSMQFALMIIFSIALLVEFAQFFLPSHYPDITDVIFSVLAGVAGYWTVYTLQTRFLHTTNQTPS